MCHQNLAITAEKKKKHDEYTYLGSAAVAHQALQDQGSGPPLDQVVQETWLCLGPLETLHEGHYQGDQLCLPQTSGLTGWL